MRPDSFSAVRQLEKWLSWYTEAPFVVTTHRCMSAITMVCEYLRVENVSVPRFTYRGLPPAILRSGGFYIFDDRNWHGAYRLNPYPIWDSARRFTSGMYLSPGMWGEFVCVSFHYSKILGYTQGGAILTNDAVAAEWFRQGRDYGREEGMAAEETIPTMIGWDYYMMPDTASGILRAAEVLPMHNDDLPNSKYTDLSLTDWIKIWNQQRKRESIVSASI